MATTTKKKAKHKSFIKKKYANTALGLQQMMLDYQREMNYQSVEAQKVIQQMSNDATSATQEYNSTEASSARTWQKEMSNTSHQREVADLKKAGLNPVLSANNGGAQSYTTSSASAQAENPSNATASLVNALMSSMGSMAGTMMSARSNQMIADQTNKNNLKIARINAAASNYAADRSASASEYIANMSYRTAMDRPASDLVSLFDKYLGKYFSSGNAEKDIEDFRSNPGKYLTNKNEVWKEKPLLSAAGKWLANKYLDSYNVPRTLENQQTVINALRGDSSNIKSLRELVNFYKDKESHKTHGMQK